jgi:hypothetical protein
MSEDGQLIARGKVLALKPSTFEGKTSVAVQMLKRTAKGSMDILNIKMPDGTSLEECTKMYPEGSDIEFAVDFVAVERNVYFRFLRDLRAEARGAARASTRQAAASP